MPAASRRLQHSKLLTCFQVCAQRSVSHMKIQYFPTRMSIIYKNAYRRILATGTFPPHRNPTMRNVFRSHFSDMFHCDFYWFSSARFRKAFEIVHFYWRLSRLIVSLRQNYFPSPRQKLNWLTQIWRKRRRRRQKNQNNRLRKRW